MQTEFKPEKGTTRELVSAAAVLTVLATNVVPEQDDLTDDDRDAAKASLMAIYGGEYLRPTGTGNQLRTGKALAAVVQQRTAERPMEAGFAVAVGGVLITGAN